MRKLFPLLAIFVPLLQLQAQNTTPARSPELTRATKEIVGMPDSLAAQSVRMLDSLAMLKSTSAWPLNLADIYIEKSRKERTMGAVDNCINSLTQSYRIYDSLHYEKGMQSSLINLGVVRIIQNKPKLAREYFENALRFKKNTSDTLLAKIYLNLGVTYDMEGQSKKAIEIYETASVYAEKIKDDESIATVYHSIGIAYAMLNDFAKSEPYELKALQSNPSPKLRSQILGSLGSFYHNFGQPEKAEKYSKEAIALAEKEGYWDVLLTCYLNLSDLYTDIGHDSEAVAPLRKYIALKDSIDLQNTNEQLTEQEARFRFDLQRKALELAELKAGGQRRWVIAVSIICILLIAISVVMYRNYRLKQRANKMLELEKRQIELERLNMQEENLILQKENLTAKFETLRNQVNPHFLFNALNSLYALVETDTKRSQEFIRQFSQLYRKVLEFNDMPVISLQQEMELVNHYLFLQKIRFDSNLLVNIQIDASLLNLYIPPFAVQMLIENAVKHNTISSENPLSVTISAIPSQRKLVVSNSLNSRKAADGNSTGTGLKNIGIIKSLVYRVNRRYFAMFEQTSKYEHGFTEFIQRT
ncbi:MAG: tetratricopeptide repeat protein [Bacteroidia bacterium]|jgi:tetratricopeptide (TPR) repeat protein|nr:tetratricopeptide repeat protein [Bacteroidia bacterium]